MSRPYLHWSTYWLTLTLVLLALPLLEIPFSLSFGVSPAIINLGKVNLNETYSFTLYVSSPKYESLKVQVVENSLPFTIAPSSKIIELNNSMERVRFRISFKENFPRDINNLTLLFETLPQLSEKAKYSSGIINAISVPIFFNISDEKRLGCEIFSEKVVGTRFIFGLKNIGTSSLRPKLTFFVYDSNLNPLTDINSLTLEDLFPGESKIYEVPIPITTLSKGSYFLDYSLPDCNLSKTLKFDFNVSPSHSLELVDTKISEGEKSTFIEALVFNKFNKSSRVRLSVVAKDSKGKVLFIKNSDEVIIDPYSSEKLLLSIPEVVGNNISFEVRAINDEQISTNLKVIKLSSTISKKISSNKSNIKLVILVILLLALFFLILKIFRRKNIERIYIFIILSLLLFPFPFSSAEIVLSKPTQYIAINATNVSYAIDSNTNSFLFSNTSGNVKFFSFNTYSYTNQEIFNITLVITFNTSFSSPSNFSIFYSYDSSNSFILLDSFTTSHSTLTKIYDLKDLSDNVWAWQDVANNLTILINYSLPSFSQNEVRVFDLYINISSDLSGPNITIISPLDSDLVNYSLVNFTFIPSDISNISQCDLFVNSSLVNSSTSITNGTTNILSHNFLSQGNFLWHLTCYDNSSATLSTTTPDLNLYVDLLPPSISLLSPSNNSVWTSSNDVTFTYSVSDVSSILNCSLYINNSLQQTSFFISKTSPNEFIQTLNNGIYSWNISCYDQFNRRGFSQTYFLNVSVPFPPKISNIYLTNVSLTPAQNITFFCNSTIFDNDGVSDILEVNASLTYNDSKPYDKVLNYTFFKNTSCSLTQLNSTHANVSCSFSLPYYVPSGKWYCNFSVKDSHGLADEKTLPFIVNPLYAFDINPLVIDFGAIEAGKNSTQDVVINVTNYGNMEIDVSIWGYAVVENDGLAMTCSRGNISIEAIKYSEVPGQNLTNMYNLTSTPYQLDTFNLKARNETFSGKSKLYWKISVPVGVKGSCHGFVVIALVPS